MITLEQLTNYVDGLQQRYIREHLIPANAILMPRWAFLKNLKEQTKNQVIIPIPNNEFFVSQLFHGFRNNTNNGR